MIMNDINLEYFLTNYIHRISNKLQNTKIGYTLHNKISRSKEKSNSNINEKICKDYKFFTRYNYNKSIDIDEINQYTVLDVNIDVSDSLKIMAKKCLKNILKSKKILVNNNPVHLKIV